VAVEIEHLNKLPMKTKIIFLSILLCAAVISCEEEKAVSDTVYEFVSFRAETVSVDEFDNSTESYPVIVQLWASKPYSEDIDVTLEITGHNAVKDVDFTVTPDQSVKIRAGSLVSDTLFIRTIDNASGVDDERSFDIKIGAVSKSDIKIGLGIAAPKKSILKVVIIEDDCNGSPLCAYNTGLNNTINGSKVNPVEVVLDKGSGKLSVTGDLIDYDVFPAATLTLTLTPESEGAAIGTATFGEQVAGTDDEGYEYKFVEVGEGSYDATAGTISIEYDIYYMDGGDWIYWYSVTNVFSVP
jgi:hypothetical protein